MRALNNSYITCGDCYQNDNDFSEAYIISESRISVARCGVHKRAVTATFHRNRRDNVRLHLSSIDKIAHAYDMSLQEAKCRLFSQTSDVD